MKITKSAPFSGTRSHGDRDLQMKWQGKKNPHAEQGTGKETKLSYLSNKQETELYNKKVIGLVMVSAGVLGFLFLKHSVNKIHCFYLLAVNDFRINLGSSDIRVSH